MKEDADIWNYGGKSLEFQQNYESAAACYERSMKFGDDSPENYLNRAASYLQLYEFYNQDKYLQIAKQALLKGIDKEPRNRRFHHYLGLVYLALGERENAANEFFYAEEIKSEEESDLLIGFDLPMEAPVVYESPQSEVYELLPDPTLHKIFNIVRGFPMDSALYESLKETYGVRDSESLLALYLRSIYFKVFEDRELSEQIGLKENQTKWEALLVFFVRGINQETKELVKKSIKGGKLDSSLLPAYTKILVERYEREVISKSKNYEDFRALLLFQIKKLEALDSACELAKEAKEGADMRKQMERIADTLVKSRLAYLKGNVLILSESLVSRAEAQRIEAKLEAGKMDNELFVLLHNIFRRKRLEYALELAQKIRALYDEEEANSYIKDILSGVKLSEEEKSKVLSEN